MDVKDYISSDILDRYVLGAVSDQERKEVECMSHIYPEIKTAVDDLQQSVNKYVSSYEKTPPATFLYSDILSKLTSSQNETLALADKLQQMHEFSGKQIEQLRTENKLVAENVAMFNSPENKIIKMAGTEKKAPAAHATICWNTTTKEVQVGFSNLPAPPSGKQYQLWAIADGKPVDLGVIDKAIDTAAIQKMKVTEKAQAFAVTLEKSGGSPTPTLEEMYAVGSTN